MLPNIRLSGTANTPIDSIGDFLGVSSSSVARSAATAAAVVASNVNRTSASNELANRYAAAVSASSGWGNSTILDFINNTTGRCGAGAIGGGAAPGSEANKTLAYYVKESASLQNALNQPQQHQQQQQQQQLHRHASLANNNHTTSLPWAAAVKATEQQQHQQQQQQQFNVASNQSANAFERNNTIGSWSSPETSSSTRSGWNADGSLKGDGVPDDGTAIWGNPSTKKAGIDWAEKESLLNPPQVNNTSSEKRIQKAEPTISSINGTEAWGAPPPTSGPGASSLTSKQTTNSQQQSKSNENSGNIYGTKSIKNEPLGWGDSSSSISSSLKQGNTENSSPPTNSIWNNLTSNGKQQKSSTDWLSSSPPSNSSSQVAVNNSRIEELNKQLEATSIFDALSSTSPPSASSSMVNHISSSSSLSSMVNHISSSSSLSSGNNPNYENQSSATNNIAAGGLGGSNSFNDLKQMSANFNKNEPLFDPLSSRPPICALSPSSSANNNPQSQMNPYSLGITPSRDLLKQMVHQIQLAVQAGHLNAQILNQPMSTPTLQLVYTLLQQIKLLQQFQEVQQRTVNKLNGRNSPSNLDLQINRVQQNISLLHKAITQQQAALTKNETLVDTNPFAPNQRSPPSTLYEWGSIGSSSMQYNAEPAPIGSKQSSNPNNGNRMPSSSSTIWSNPRPAPPPGLMSNFGSIIGGGSNSSRSTNDMSSLDSNKFGKSGDEPQLPSLDSSPNLWSGTWFD